MFWRFYHKTRNGPDITELDAWFTITVTMSRKLYSY